MNDFIPEHFKFLEKRFIYRLEHTHKIKINPSLFKKKQIGGKIIYKTKTYANKHFNFKIDDDDPDDIRIAIITPNQTECVTVLVHTELRLAILHNMTYDNKCAKEGLGKPGGDILMKVMLTFLIKKRKKYNIDRIVLADHSFLYCGEEISNTIKLARLRTITHGRPWYMKYGFKPYNPYNNTPDTEALQWIDYNRYVLDTLQTNAVDIMKIANKMENLDKLKIKKLINKYPLFRDFIKRLVSELNEYCPFIDAILEDIYKATPLHHQILYDWYMKDFYLDIKDL